MRVAVAQINPKLGDFENNKNKILDFIQRAQQRHCDLVVFPEAALFGYHPFDLLERGALVDLQLKKLKEIEKKIPKGICALIGVFTKNTAKKGRPYFNSAALVEKGKKTKFFHKELLPTGDVFDEARFIESGKIANSIFNLKKKKILVTICEDIWAWPDQNGKSQYLKNPLAQIKSRMDLVINISASPFYPKKPARRRDLVKKTAKHFKAPVVYVNLIGAQDELIFDGGSFALDQKGKEILSSISFEEDLNVLDLESMQGGGRTQIHDDSEMIRRALVLGIRDFCEKTGIQRVHLGLSGGVDSALVACLAVEALGASKVTGIAMPGPFSSAESLSLAEKLAKNLSIHFLQAPITKAYELLKQEIDSCYNVKEFSVMHENLQARLRGLFLMAYSNKENSLLLSTGNKSEYATGYSTLYGDMCGGLVPIGDLTKKQVYEICDIYNQEMEIIPEQILTRAPTAELRPGQKDQDTLPEYDELDRAVEALVEHSREVQTKTEKWLQPVLMRTEFKRWQAAPILKVSKHSFGRGRRFPIALKNSELE
ncbi:MAG: NAD+ synthase [Oligoflexia bacterium]|nr:MAG: NAD+ synthase [Oligoflexia bacterium]